MKTLLIAIALLVSPFAALAETAPVDAGQVTVPLSFYTQMVDQLSKQPRAAPAAYAIGQANVSVQVRALEDRFTATVNVTLRVETFEDEWTLVPILPPGTVLRQATANGRPVQLVQGPRGLAWSTPEAGVVTMQLSYGVDARRSESGFVLPLPVPVAAATTLSLSFPGSGPDLAIVPSADLRAVEGKGVTHYTASIPATSSILVSWRAAAEHPYAISRATYDGVLKDDAVVWTARFQVEMFAEEQIILPLMPASVTLNDIRVDGGPATVLEQSGRFSAVLDGRDMHDVTVVFQVPVVDDGGPPEARLQIPRIPVSRFDLILPGKKAVKVSLGANVVLSELGETTKASVFIPMSDSVVFSWTNALPENLGATFRANASLYHVIHAEEGVLHGRAAIVYEISRGETNQLTLEIPSDTQVNRITAPNGGLSDWAVTDSERPGWKTINVFLEVAVSGEFVLDVSYERLLGSGAGPDEAIAVPLLSADNVHRQRGMVALLSGQELALKPVTETGVSRVGENQLPAFVRNQIAMTVAHTYKYTEPRPMLEVKTVAPERRQGKFNAQVDTLISLGDVTMKGSATVEIDVKSGTIMGLNLRLPAAVNVLRVSGPSLRSQQVREENGAQIIALDFTREMEGQFRVEVNYELIMESEVSEPAVPTIAVDGAEVEHGRIAVEALSAVEVRASRTTELSNLDINELPQQLVLKTTNPILLAYRYVHAKAPYELVLKITRHREIDVQVAAIEQAVYNTLFTRDGLAVTTARLTVRNSRRQFLRLTLPPKSEVWSVFVDGKPEKPAFASDDGSDGSAVLVKMITSDAGFPVDIVYATEIEPLDHLGTVSSQLPRPDMVVTHSRWNAFLPVGPRYQTPDSTMDLVADGIWANPRRAAKRMAQSADERPQQMGQPLRISVPTQGILFAFEKLYANESPEPAAFSIRYAAAGTDQLALLASLVGIGLLWLGIVAIGSRRFRLTRLQIVASIGLGVAVLVVTLGYLGTSPVPASGLALASAVVLAIWWGVGRLRAWRRGRRMEPPAIEPESP